MNRETRSREQGILVVRTGALGDTILTIPVLASIREAHPGQAIMFLGNRAYSDLIPQKIEFHSIDAAEWSWLFCSCQPEDCGEDLFVKRASTPPSPKTLYACRNSLLESGLKSAGTFGRPRSFGKAYVILNKPQDVMRNLARTGVRTLIHAGSSPPPGKHVVEHIHEALGLKIPARSAAFETMRGAEQDLIWLHPGSGGPRKCAPLGGLVRIAKELMATTGFELVVTAGEEDEFLKSDASWGHLINQPALELLENRPLSELLHTLSRAAIFIGNDSGIGHLAANLGVKSMIFFVASDPAQWSPWVPEDGLRIIDLRNQDLLREDWIERSVEMALDFLSELAPSCSIA